MIEAARSRPTDDRGVESIKKCGDVRRARVRNKADSHNGAFSWSRSSLVTAARFDGAHRRDYRLYHDRQHRCRYQEGQSARAEGGLELGKAAAQIEPSEDLAGTNL